MIDILWYLKQLLPLTYRTKYIEDEKQHFTVWKMWLGRNYKVEDYVVIREGETITVTTDNDGLVASVALIDGKAIIKDGYKAWSYVET